MLIKVANRKTGEVLPVDQDRCRLGRLRRRIYAWSQAVNEANRGVKKRLLMITLTYEGGPETWQPNQIRDYIKHLKREHGDGILALAWVAEIQKRGVIHYHVLVWVKRGVFITNPDQGGGWAWGMSNIQTARSVGYILKYTSKGIHFDQHGHAHRYPKGARIFAVYVQKDALVYKAVRVMRANACPCWLRDMIILDEDITAWYRNSGGGWLIIRQGFGCIVVTSPYRVLIDYDAYPDDDNEVGYEDSSIIRNNNASSSFRVSGNINVSAKAIH